MLIPSFSDIQKIFQTYHNQCAFSNCNKIIIDSDGDVNGNIYFIESNVKGNPRYNPKLTNEEIIDYHNLILLCDVHGLDIEWKEKKFTSSKLQKEIQLNQKTLNKQNFKFTNKMFELILQHFIEYHDPDRLSHVKVDTIYYYPKFEIFSETSCSSVYIKPTRHFAGGKFEITSSQKNIHPYDKVIFYPKHSSYSQGIQADITIKNDTSIYGIVPKLSEGDYFISIRSILDETSKLEHDLSFTILK